MCASLALASAGIEMYDLVLASCLVSGSLVAWINLISSQVTLHEENTVSFQSSFLSAVGVDTQIKK